MKCALVYNPKAGFKNHSREELLKKLTNRGYKVDYISSKDDSFESLLLNSKSDLVVVAGGDGTVKKVVQLLMGQNIPIEIVPLGTANNIARTLAPGKQPDGKPTISNFDVGILTGLDKKRYFIESTGFGLIAEMMYRHELAVKEKQLEFESPDEEIRYIQSFLIDLLQGYTANDYSITIDNETFTGKYLLVEVMNIKSIGPQLALAANADPGDSLLDVVLIREEEKKHFSDYLSSLLEGKKEAADFTVKKGKKITIRWNESVIHIDDEIILDVNAASNNSMSVNISMGKQKLNVIPT